MLLCRKMATPWPFLPVETAVWPFLPLETAVWTNKLDKLETQGQLESVRLLRLVCAESWCHHLLTYCVDRGLVDGAHVINIFGLRFTYNVFGREFTKYTVMHIQCIYMVRANPTCVV
jgi:hypothetical protein